MQDEDTFKSTYDIMLGIGQVWEQMSDIDQAALLELLAGKRQGNALAATLTNLEDMQRALEVSENSAGSAMREHEVWLDSVDAKTQQFKASFESLSATMIDTDFLKGVVDAGTGFIQGIDHAIQGLQQIPGLLPGVKALVTTLAFPMAATSIGNFLFAPRGEAGISRLGELGVSAKASASRLRNFLSIGGMTTEKLVTHKGAGLNGGDILAREMVTKINPYTTAILGAVAALGALYAAKKAYDSYVENRRSRALDEVEEYESRAEAINKYKDRFIDLRQQIDSGTLSSSEELAARTELVQIQSELNSLIGAEANALDLVNGSLEQQIGLMNQLTKSEFSQWESRNREAIDLATEELSAGRRKVSMMDANERLRGSENRDAYLRTYKQIVDAIRQNEKLGDKIADQFIGKEFSDFGLNLSGLDAWEAVDAAEALKGIIEQIGFEGLGEDWYDYFGGFVRGAEEASAMAQKLRDDNEQLFTDWATNKLKTDDRYSDLYGGILAAQQQFNEAYEKNDREGMERSLNMVNELRDQLAQRGLTPELETFMDHWLDDWEEQTGTIQADFDLEAHIRNKKEAADQLKADLEKSFGDNGTIDISQIVNVGYQYAAGDFDENSQNLTAQQQSFLKIKAAADEAGVSIGDYVKKWAEVEGIELNDDLINQLQTYDDYLESLKHRDDISSTAEIDTTIKGEEKIDQLNQKKKELEEPSTVEIKTDITGEKEMDEFSENVLGLPKEKTTEFKGKDSNLTTTAKKASKETGKVPEKKETKFEGKDNSSKVSQNVTKAANLVPSVKTTVLKAVDNASTVINNVKSAISTVARNIVINLSARFSGVKESWTGTTHATEGLTLVGERGEELVQSKGKAYFVGTDHPEIVYLKQGDIVYNAQETKQIKNGSKVIRPNTMNAMADGTNNTGRLTSPYVSARTRESFNFLPANGEQGDNFKLEEQLKDALDAIDKKVKESLNNYEHQILIMEKNNVNSSELIKVYRDMQAEASRIANEYRAKGLNDNSDYIQDLQKQWWDYADKIKELIAQQYEETRKLSENAIELNTNWLNRAVENNDYDGVLQYSQNIVQNYKYMQEQIHEQAEYYRSLGYTDTSDEVSELSNLWYEYRDKIIEATSQAYIGMVEAAGDAVDNIQSLYSTLITAGEEYADSGHITIDTFQDLVNLGTKYLAFLIDENGQLVINEESIKRVLAAKTKELAVTEALNYVAQIRSAVQDGNIAKINALCDATNDLTEASWGLVYAQLGELDLSDEQYRSALLNINRLRALSENAINNIDHELAMMKGDVGDILEYVKEMVKQEVENHIDALEQQIEDYNEIVDLQKESLRLQKEKDEYTKDVAKQTKDIAELQARIAQLDLDDSREAQAQKLKLQEELAEKQEKLADDQSDHSYDATVNALDKMADAYEKEKNKEIKILEDTISSEEKIYQMAITRIDTGWDNLYDDLIHWNTEYGSHLNDEITSAWKEALEMAEKYGDYLTFLNVKKTTDANGNTIYDSSETKRKDIVGKSLDDSAIRQKTTEMYQNSEEWKRINDEPSSLINTKKKDDLAARNYDLAQEIENMIGEKLVRGTDGVWYLGKVGGRKLYNVYPAYTTYHSGGIVGDKKLFNDEEYALLQKGEVVLTPTQQESIYRRLDAFETMYGKFGNLLGTTGFVNNMNHALYSADDLANIRSAMTDNSVTTLTTTVNVSVGGSVDDEAMARRYGERIGNETIKTINDAFYKRGLNRSGNVILKQ